jgi:hypothetical protein
VSPDDAGVGGTDHGGRFERHHVDERGRVDADAAADRFLAGWAGRGHRLRRFGVVDAGFGHVGDVLQQLLPDHAGDLAAGDRFVVDLAGADRFRAEFAFGHGFLRQVGGDDRFGANLVAGHGLFDDLRVGDRAGAEVGVDDAAVLDFPEVTACVLIFAFVTAWLAMFFVFTAFGPIFAAA